MKYYIRRKSSKLFRINFAIVLALTLGLVSCSNNNLQSHNLLEQVPNPIEFHPNRVAQWQLENGLEVIFREDFELPILSGSLYLPGGTYYQSEVEHGLFPALGAQMREGGAGALSPKQLDLKLEQLGASIGSSYGRENGSVTFRCLASDAREVFELFSDVVLRPKFDAVRLALWQLQLKESIAKRTDDPSTVALYTLMPLLYGNSPYGQFSVSSDVERINRMVLLKKHRQFVRPNHAILVLTGAIKQADARRLIEANFSQWRPSNEQFPNLPDVESKPHPGIYFVNMPFAQSTIYLAQLGPARHTTDEIAIDTFNDLFGSSGFGSRLFQTIRTELGLAYDVSGSIMTDKVRGMNLIRLQTKAENSGQAIEAAIRILLDMQSSLASDDEVERVKRSISNSFVFRYSSPASTATRVAALKLFGYPADYDDTYIEKLDLVDSKQIRMVAQKYWDLSQFLIIVVGPQNAIDSINKVKNLPESSLSDYSITTGKFDERFHPN